MTDLPLFLFSVREMPLAHIFQGSANRFLSAEALPSSSMMLSEQSENRTPNVSSGYSGTPEDPGALSGPPRSTPPESDPTKADPHDLDEEEKYSPETPGDEQSGQRR